MKMIIISEKRLDELVDKMLADVVKSPNSEVILEAVMVRTVNYHLRMLVDALKNGPLGT